MLLRLQGPCHSITRIFNAVFIVCSRDIRFIRLNLLCYIEYYYSGISSGCAWYLWDIYLSLRAMNARHAGEGDVSMVWP
jgi:hypothetical protein